MPFIEGKKLSEEMFAAGVARRYLKGTNVGIAFAAMEKTESPASHSHEYEQVTVVVSGCLQLRVGDETRTVTPGDVILIPPGIEHAHLETIEDSFVVDIFSPPRERLGHEEELHL